MPRAARDSRAATALFLHRTVRDDQRAGLAAVAGNEIGVFCWAVAGGGGLSVLLAANRVLSTRCT